jgi:hypothetical protein
VSQQSRLIGSNGEMRVNARVRMNVGVRQMSKRKGNGSRLKERVEKEKE